MTTAERFDGLLPKGASTDDLKKTFNSKNILFYIERTTNSNAVIYEANIAGDKLDEKEPVKVYWIMYAKSPVNEEGLNMIERNTAYGSTTEPNAAKGPGNYTLTLAALKEKKISVSLKPDGKVSATAEVNGDVCELVHIFVDSTTSWGMPKVNHIDVKGRKEDGTIVTERIKK